MSSFIWLIIPLVIIFILAIVGLLIQWIRDNTASKIYAPGQLFNVPPNIHLRVLDPPKRKEFSNPNVTIIFESGLGNNCLTWSFVQPKISESVRTVSYDRAGMGWSGHSNKARTSDQIAKELSLALQEAKIEGPFILVGHSAGGVFIRSFYKQNQKEVIGMILVDASHPNEILSGFTLWRIYYKFLYFLGNFGVKLLARNFMGKTTPQFSKWNQDLALQKKSYATIYQEFKALPESFKQVKQLENYGDLPLYILTHVEGNKNSNWIDWQKDFLSLSSDSRQILCKTSHYIHIDNPTLVIESIEEIIEKNWKKIT
ncbi:2-succinyl-6-hydroxy-2,4-cyclohexadiene-1-carboxylate synthase [Candidatus Lokiarchaeum ossiferum]|uniref:2-succinyl-6-hydroxy-2, 4-cyclohexadiene-1-carboxylate synthase n=1 Tax=Candidatus Lokiarchaeum ossiferum TaxID=2951803 RepID=A0ABY6HUX7_9ARCH|nr:2-succinyl-6-hydroxy-2,4-cyclohexadiene-1-carboxylate synthase [Candidatus Lokiarchaeum sp. B-35]